MEENGQCLKFADKVHWRITW